MKRKSLIVNERDNVAMLLEDAQKGDCIETPLGLIKLLEDVEFAHKVLLTDLKKDAPVVKYGEEIGRVKADTPKGTWIHNHNMGCERGTK